MLFAKKPPLLEAKRKALLALWEDAKQDRTSAGCMPAKAGCAGRIVAKSSFVLCGIYEAGAIFRSRGVKVRWRFAEGEKVRRGSTVALLEGNCRAILACERTALNYLMLLCGIATKSARAAQRYGRWRISATRKTLPLLGNSQKRAVLVGGCLTHRLSLADAILIKDNHISAIEKRGGVTREEAIAQAVRSFPRKVFVEVEVSSVSEAVAAAKAGARAILADNVKPALLKKISRAARKISKGMIIEASGGISIANAGRYLRAGADFVSTSELTMKIEPAALSLEIDRAG
ncbi:MAG: carboxylating nicotinate-nucleotide diphosphorylase [Candidatus Micrarchaeota archaeon]|nr:carboxylating nicotinate-nucleotide diphosphorylase [Candidatus Micrarchaeota archaeon]